MGNFELSLTKNTWSGDSCLPVTLHSINRHATLWPPTCKCSAMQRGSFLKMRSPPGLSSIYFSEVKQRNGLVWQMYKTSTNQVWFLIFMNAHDTICSSTNTINRSEGLLSVSSFQISQILLSAKKTSLNCKH